MANVALHVHAVVRGAYRDSPRAHGGSPDRRGRFLAQIAFSHDTLLSPTILTAVLLRIIDALRVFSEVYVMTEGGPGSATMLFSLYTQRQAFGYQKVGMASAMAIFLLILSIVFALTLVRKNMSLDVLEEKAGA